ESGISLGRPEAGRTQRTGASDREATWLRPGSGDEITADGLHTPEISAIGKTADRILSCAVSRRLQEHGRESGGRTNLPVISDDPARIADRRPGDRERLANDRAILRRNQRRRQRSCCGSDTKTDET